MYKDYVKDNRNENTTLFDIEKNTSSNIKNTIQNVYEI